MYAYVYGGVAEECEDEMFRKVDFSWRNIEAWIRWDTPSITSISQQAKAYFDTITPWRNQVFKKISFSPKVKEIAKSLDLKDPAIVQGMYIFKQPGIGGFEIIVIVTMAMMTMLAERWRKIINHFKVVKFRLFLYKKSVKGRSFEGINVKIFP